MSLKISLLVAFLTSMVSTADCLKCYTCAGSTLCIQTTCSSGQDRCLKIETGVPGVFTKSCGSQSLCGITASTFKTYCCATDLCNGAGITGNNLLFLLLPLISICLLS